MHGMKNLKKRSTFVFNSGVTLVKSAAWHEPHSKEHFLHET